MGFLDSARTVDTHPADRWTFVLYGFPGSGKSVFAAHAPNPFVFMIDPDGEESYRNHPSLKATPYIKIKSLKQMRDALARMAKDKDLDKVDTVVVDTVSELMMIDRVDQVDDDGKSVLEDTWVFNQNTWTKNNYRINLLMKMVLDLGKNTIFICHLKEETNPKTLKTKLRLHLSPEIQNFLLAKTSGTFIYSFEGTERHLRVASNPSDSITKTRYKFNTKIGYLVNPTFNDLLKVLERRND